MVNELDLRTAHQELKRGHLALGGADPSGRTLELTSRFFEHDGVPILPALGEFQFSRHPEADWDEEILKMKMGGVTIVASYVFWIHHEEEEGLFDWSGRRDVRRFVTLCAAHGLWVLLRIGPFAHGECRNGGLPDWLYGRPFKVRSNDEGYLAFVARYYSELGARLEGLTFAEGGPIVGVQLDNEFMNTGAPWEILPRSEEGFYPHFMNAGKGGVRHMRNLMRLAREAGLTVPLYTATAWGSPIVENEMLPVWGPCGYVFKDYQRDRHVVPEVTRFYEASDYPFAIVEMTAGMLQFHTYRPPYADQPEHADAFTTVALGCGAALVGFYVYHGGSNPVTGRRGFLNESGLPRISYDFEAPIREFGQLLPSYHHLRRLLLFLKDFGGMLAPLPGVYPPGEPDIVPQDTERLRWCARSDGRRGFVFLNNFQRRLDTAARDDVMRPNIDIERPVGELSDEDRRRLASAEWQMPMRRHEDLTFRLLRDDGALEFPARGGLVLEPGVSAILPFGLDLGGVRLRSATCQPVCRLEVDSVEHLFFFAPRGMRPEYVFDDEAIERAVGRDVRIERSGGRIVAVPEPGTGSVLEIAGREGRRLAVVTLTEDQANRLWKFELAGRERVALAGCGLLARGNDLTLYSVGDPDLAVSLFPAPGGATTTEHAASGPASLTTASDGIFTRYSVPAPAVAPEVEVRMVRRDKAVVTVAPGALGAAHDVFLRIRAAGDTFFAFVDGELVSDTHLNGTAWEIGLRRFFPRIAEKGMHLCVSPLVRGTKLAASILPQLERALGRTFDEEEVAELVSIEAVPEYRRTLTVSE